MRIIGDLLKINEGDDLSRLPKDVLSGIKKNIRKGAEDLDQKWGNALELVHKAYEVEGVERPEPSMKTAWEQYETMLAYAVQQLGENRGMDADWRMSSSVFHEALEPRDKYEVEVIDRGTSHKFITEAKRIEDLLDAIPVPEGFQAREHQVGGVTEISYDKWGIKQDFLVKIGKI